MNSVGSRLKKLRLYAKKTLNEESKTFNVSLNSVYRWEHDLCVPRKSVLMEIASYYDVPLEWLLNGDGSIGEDGDKGEENILIPERDIERKILKMIRKLPNSSKYKIIGYIERMCMENEE